MATLPFVIVVGGPSGTGKTTIATKLAEALSWPSIEGDEFHSKENVAKMHSGVPLTDEDRRPWLQSLHKEVIAQSVREKKRTVLSCSSLKRAYRDTLRSGLPDGAVYFVLLTGTKDTLTRRVASRKGHFMNAALVQSQLDTLELLQPDEKGLCIDCETNVADIVNTILSSIQPPPSL